MLPFAGVTGVSPLRALLPAATASALWYALLVLLGTTVAGSWEEVRLLLGTTNRTLVVVSSALAVAAAVWVWRHIRSQRERAD